MKILLLLPEAFTECLLATPLVRCLHHRLPDAELHTITGKEGKEALRNNPFINRLSVWSSEESSVASLKTEEFSFVVDLNNSNASEALASALTVDVCRPQKRRWQRWLYNNLGRRISPKQHLVDFYFTAVSSLGVYNDGAGLDYFIPADSVVQSHDIPHSHHAGFICLSIGGSQEDIRLPATVWQTVAKNISHPIILIGKREDALTGEAVATIDPTKIYNSCGKFSMAESADLIRQSKLLIGSDITTLQMAAALQREVIAIGEAASFFDLRPYYGEKFLQRHPSSFEVVPLQKRWLRYRNKKVSVDVVVNKAMLRLHKKKRQ